MSVPFIVAAAQSVSIAGDVQENVDRHLVFLREAAARGSRMVVFPELSLTGYEMAVANELAFRDDDARLAPLRDECVRRGLTAVVGAPLRFNDVVRIGALALGPDGTVSCYTKQYLHPGEDSVFVPGSGGRLLSVDGMTVALAICADTGYPEHAVQAASTGASLYAAGVLITASGYDADTALLQGYAAQHRFAVLMANHGGDTGGWSPIGKSTFWDEDGRCVVAAEGTGAALVMVSLGFHSNEMSHSQTVITTMTRSGATHSQRSHLGAWRNQIPIIARQQAASASPAAIR
ncbi:carbon-nitrogen hydrolase family protein [Cupriavidus lacunae]|uniref:Carbon-nitrogen hydrolase family protein n=1 Tax=Cupriavidus lacunae TaxID=2666307 RepID=A0A370NPX5_9BURK|nr:carbon-nitrogen hydrolase family protein [Cupriavidus lacunae]RDK07588.1 carbon-nitrogen hydrolase family protein [Cupriavidus lacunae]